MTKSHRPTKLFGAALATVFAVAALGIPALARDFVQDGAGLFNATTVSALDAKIGDFNRQTGKEVVVVTVPSLDGVPAQTAAEKTFATQQVNGVLIFLSKAEKKDGIIPDRASRAFFSSGSFDSIRQAMRGYFRTGNFDEGITTGVDLVLNGYRGHERSLGAPQRHRQLAPTSSSSSLGGGMSLIWLILILIAGFLVIRAIFRAMSRPRPMPPGYGGQPGYGQGPGPGYGGGMGGGMMGGGGGGFFSGLLGGLGGAFLGNELFGRHDGGGFGGGNDQAGFIGGDSGQQADASGWQSDAGQADMGGASFGDYGSSGGGFDSGGGGGGFDSGGGGDSGGGW